MKNRIKIITFLALAVIPMMFSASCGKDEQADKNVCVICGKPVEEGKSYCDSCFVEIMDSTEITEYSEGEPGYTFGS